MKPKLSNYWKDVAWLFAAFLTMFALGTWYGQCRGDEVHASPQSSSTWHAPKAPARDFATPPTDGPNPPEVQDPGQPQPPAPAPNPSPNPEPGTPPAPTKVPGKSRLTTTSESEGGLIINSNSGVIYLNSPGAQPPALASAPVPTVAAYPLIPGPLTDQQYLSLAKRIGGGLYYAVTGNCPGKAKAAASPQMYAMVPTQAVQAVPVQMAQAPAPPPVAAAPMYVMPPQSPVYAAPQYAVQPQPEAPRKSSWCPWKK